MSFKLADVPSNYSSDPKLKKRDVIELAEWVNTQPHLPRMEEIQLILFLHSCYYDLDRAKTTIENYFTARTNSDLFQNVTKELVTRTLTSFFIGFLPRRTDNGDAVLLMKLLDNRPEIYNCSDHTKVTLALMTLYFHQHGPADGLIVIYDMKGTSMGHFFKINLSVLKQFAHFVQEAIPTRIKHIHHINALPITGRLVALVKPFLRKELYEKVKFHQDPIESFHEFVPKACLPQDYGGTLPSIQQLKETNVQNVLKNWEFFKWHDTQRIDEGKRCKKERGFFGKMFRSS